MYMYINVIWAAFRYSLRVFNIYSARYVCYRFCTCSEYRNATL